MGVLVLACGECGVPADVSQEPEGPDARVIWAPSLCDRPERTIRERPSTEAVVFLAGTTPDDQAILAEDAIRAGVHPLRIRFLDAWRFHVAGPMLRAHVRAAIARMSAEDGIDAAPSESTRRFRGDLPRRSLLRVRPPFRSPVPRLDPSACRAALGCDLCIHACPANAIRAGRPPSVDPAACTACGLCLPVCPADAIGHPRLDFAGPFAEAKALADAGCRDLLIVCTAVLLRAGPERIRLTGGPWGLLEIPALASLGPAEVVRLAGLGFDRVVGLSDGACCPGGPGAFAVVSNVLDRIGRRDRVVAWDLRAGPMPDAWSRPPDDDSRLPVTDSLPAFVRLLAPAWTDPIPLQGRGAGEVLLNAAACTLCEVCAERCPTEAITVEHSSGGTVRLTFDAGRCDACGLCVDACPERATSVRQMLDVQASRVVLHEDTWIRCSSCGAKVAPRGMVELVARRLGEPAGLDLCVDCKPRLALRSAARRARQDRAGARAP